MYMYVSVSLSYIITTITTIRVIVIIILSSIIIVIVIMIITISTIVLLTLIIILVILNVKKRNAKKRQIRYQQPPRKKKQTHKKTTIPSKSHTQGAKQKQHSNKPEDKSKQTLFVNSFCFLIVSGLFLKCIGLTSTNTPRHTRKQAKPHHRPPTIQQNTDPGQNNTQSNNDL